MEAVGPAAFDLPLGPSSAGGATGGYSGAASGDGDADIARLRREFDRRVMAGKRYVAPPPSLSLPDAHV